MPSSHDSASPETSASRSGAAPPSVEASASSEAAVLVSLQDGSTSTAPTTTSSRSEPNRAPRRLPTGVGLLCVNLVLTRITAVEVVRLIHHHAFSRQVLSRDAKLQARPLGKLVVGQVRPVADDPIGVRCRVCSPWRRAVERGEGAGDGGGAGVVCESAVLRSRARAL